MGGAKNCPETPRQKMIGMMYLVLTAMLALNVSSSILEGFSMVDSSLHTTIQSSNFRNNKAYADFDDLFSKNKTKYGEWLAKAKQVKAKSDELYNYIENFKKEIIRMVDSDDANDSAYVKQIKNKENMDKAAEYAINKGNGKILKKKINEFADFLVTLSGDDNSKKALFKSIFSTQSIKQKDGGRKEWEDAIFEDVPVAAVITVLTKYQSDVRASEAEMVEFLKGRSDASDLRVNKLMALVIPESKYVLRGDKYSARIVLSAVDTTSRPTFQIGGSQLPIKDGIYGMYEVGCGATGKRTFSGTATFKNQKGELIQKPFSSEYTVGEPSATISNEDLNVVYKGIDNKFSVSAPGVSADRLSVRADGASVSQRGPGRFIIKTSRDGIVKISVYAKNGGKDQLMGSQDFRVKVLPKPAAYILSSDGSKIDPGSVSALSLRGATVAAGYGPEELIKQTFRIVSCSVSVKGWPSQNLSSGNPRLPSDLMGKVLKGDVVLIYNIRVVGSEDNVERNLPAIAYQVK